MKLVGEQLSSHGTRSQYYVSVPALLPPHRGSLAGLHWQRRFAHEVRSSGG